MLNSLFEFSLRNRFLVLVFVGLIIAAGVYAMRKLPIDAVPDVTPNQVQILTDSPGLGPVEVEKFITFPVETALSGLPGITLIRSVSRFGLSAVTVYFEEGMDIYFCRGRGRQFHRDSAIPRWARFRRDWGRSSSSRSRAKAFPSCSYVRFLIGTSP